jgi:hypothetical protein
MTNTSPGRPPKYPWRTIEVGQSFLVLARTSTSLQHDAARYYRPRRYKCRKVMKNGVTGIRVERIM